VTQTGDFRLSLGLGLSPIRRLQKPTFGASRLEKSDAGKAGQVGQTVFRALKLGLLFCELCQIMIMVRLRRHSTMFRTKQSLVSA